MANLKQEITDLAHSMGIDKVGFTSKERLSDAPPSGDLSYVLPGAKSAISLAVALDKGAIRDFLSKKDQRAHNKDHERSYMTLIQVGLALVQLLKDKGYQAVALWPNYEYRKNQPYLAMVPPLSHRYVAVAAGIGWLGWSGNVITPEYGATVSLLSVVTSAEIEPDQPLEQGNGCEKCRLCAASCPGLFINPKEEIHVAIAGKTYKHNKKAINARCEVSCGGANGVRNRESKWSTWSYKVLDLPGPGKDEEFMRVVLEYARDPSNRMLRILLDAENLDLPPLESAAPFMEKMLFTCGNCMLICWPDMEDRKENHRLLTTSGRVVKGAEGIVVIKS